MTPEFHSGYGWNRHVRHGDIKCGGHCQAREKEARRKAAEPGLEKSVLDSVPETRGLMPSIGCSYRTMNSDGVQDDTKEHEPPTRT